METPKEESSVPVPPVEHMESNIFAQQPPPTASAPAESNAGDGDAPDTKRPKKAPTKSAEEIAARRREGRAKAAASLAEAVKNSGIGRAEATNQFSLTLVRLTALINQKNYFTDYLKKDEQVGFIRNWRRERDFVTKVKKGQVDEAAIQETLEGRGEISKFEYFDIQEVVNLTKKTSLGVASTNDDGEDDEDDEDDGEGGEKSKNGYDVVVIHPGSLVTRIGRATDIQPRHVPTVVAVPLTDPPHHDGNAKPERKVAEELVTFGTEFDEIKLVITKDFKARMKFYKRRILPNSHETAANFNRKQSPEEVPDHNDPDKKEWSNGEGRKYIVGDDALKLRIDLKSPEGEYIPWKLRYPLVAGRLNQNLPDYSLSQEIMGDLAMLVLQTLTEIEVEKPEKVKAILIIPDLYDKTYVETWMDILLRLVGVSRVGVIQELVAATFGAGATLACVVDVGAQTTSIACVEEGMIINDLRVRLEYGGDHITELFVKFLLEGNFPYSDINLNRENDDWQLAEQLKQQYCTFQDTDIAVQLYNFYKRKPWETTEKYEFKVFDSVMLAPLGIYFPRIFDLEPPLVPLLLLTPNAYAGSRLFRKLVDQYTDSYDNPTLKTQQVLGALAPLADLTDSEILLRIAEFVPSKLTTAPDPILKAPGLEKAIIESITNAGLSLDMSKVKKMYDNLLIVGGGLANFPGFDLVLADRISIWRPKFLSTDNTDKVIGYVKQELKKGDDKRTELINELKLQRRTLPEQTLDDIELTPEEIAEIDAETEVVLDLEQVDAICDQGEQLLVSVLPPPREFDPESLTWKGGSVFGRLKVVQELWITQDDWDLLRTRCLYYKLLWQY